MKVYGFFPFPPSDRIALYEPLVHGHNERIHVDDLAYATHFMYDLIATFRHNVAIETSKSSLYGMRSAANCFAPTPSIPLQQGDLP